MAATVQDILIEQGATFRKTLTVKDALGVVVNISAWTGRGKLKAKATDTVSLADFTFDFTQGALGKVSFELVATVTDGLVTTGEKYSAFTKLVYDVELVDGAEVYRAANGFANVSPSVTK